MGKLTTFSAGARGASTGLGKALGAILGGGQSYQDAYDSELGAQSNIARALAQVRASDAAAGLHEAQAASVAAADERAKARPGLVDAALAAYSGTDVPTLNAYRQKLTTGQAPQVPMGPPAEDGGMGVGSQQFSPEVSSRIGQALSRFLPVAVADKDVNPEQWAKAQGLYRAQDLGDQVLAGTQTPAAVGRAQAAVEAKPLYHAGENGAVLDLFGGGLNESGGLAQGNIGLIGAKTKEQAAAAAHQYAGASAQTAQAAKLRAETAELTSPDAASKLSPAAVENAAIRYNTDGTLPPMAMGAKGSIGRTAILNRAAELALGTPGNQRANQLDAKAAASSLSQLSKAQAMSAAFEQTANANADIALDLSKKMDRTGVPLLNAGIQALRTGTGSPEATQFAAANETFVNEYAKIMSGGLGSGPVSDQARKKASALLTTSMTQPQYEGNVKLLQREMANRMKGYEDQAATLRQRIGGQPAAPVVAPGLPAAPGKPGSASGRTVTVNY